MSDLAISVEGVSKRYSLGVTHTSLSERLGDLGPRALGRVRDRAPRNEEFWALRDVSLEIRHGESVALIGRNGAGKSTLLKLLSRITLPSEGRITLNGQVAAMLEVGTGFQHELTGRENVFLNGAILGMRRAEIIRKFDDIVEFAGVGPFLDTPVKRYSSGMLVRLAFAVAAHLEPEILIVDEVLAVGDAEFQRRCLGKMDDATAEGRTVLFVSHNQAAVRRLCGRAYLLDSGRVTTSGPTEDVLAEYLSDAGARQQGGVAWVGPEVERVASTDDARIVRVALLDRATGEPVDTLRIGQPIDVCISLEVERAIPDAAFEVGISTPDGGRVATAQNVDGGGTGDQLAAGPVEIVVSLDIALLPGDYVLDIGINRLGLLTMDWVDGVLRFNVINAGMEPNDHWPWEVVRGAVRPPAQWLIEAGEPRLLEGAGQVSATGQ